MTNGCVLASWTWSYFYQDPEDIGILKKILNPVRILLLLR